MNKLLLGAFVAAVGVGYRVVMHGDWSKSSIASSFNPVALGGTMLINETVVGKFIKPESSADKVEKCKLAVGLMAACMIYLLWMQGGEDFIVEAVYLGYVAVMAVKEARLGKLIKSAA